MLVLRVLTEHLPLQQGLRPLLARPLRSGHRLTEHLPLQQGLRQDDFLASEKLKPAH